MNQPYRPDHEARLVLRAALSDPEVAAEAWREWGASGKTIDGAGPSLVRLLPSAYHNLPAWAIAAGDRARLAGIFRQSWYGNQMRFRAVAPVLRALAARGKPALVLKGAAIATMVDHGAGLRPMLDVDLLVRPEHLGLAESILRSQGFDGRIPTGVQRRLFHACEFVTDGGSVDLHWRPLHRASSSEELWRDAVPATVQGAPVLVPCAEDLVLHACAHAMIPAATPLQWIADVVVVLRLAGDGFNWERLIVRAQSQGVATELRGALRVIADDPVAGLVPGWVLAALSEVGSGIYDRGLHALITSGRTPPFFIYLWEWDLYRREAIARGEQPTPRGFLAVLADLAEVAGPRALPGHWLRRAVGRPRRGGG